jgi:hypothetical protein
MSSYGNRFDDRSTSTGVSGSLEGASPVGDATRLRLVRDVATDAEGVLACAVAAIERVEHEIDHLWLHSMRAEDLLMSQRLAELSHALQRAAVLLESNDLIG